MWAARGGAGQRALRHWAAPYTIHHCPPRVCLSPSRPQATLSCPLDTVQTQLCQILTVVLVWELLRRMKTSSCIDVSVKEEKVAQKSLVWLRRSTFGCQCIAVSTLSWVRGWVAGEEHADSGTKDSTCKSAEPHAPASSLPPSGPPAFLFSCRTASYQPTIVACT